MGKHEQTPSQFQTHLYEAATHHWVHAEQIRWTLLSNFLIATSILLLSWAAIFGSAASSERRVVLITLSFLGILLSRAWFGLGKRANDFVEMYMKLGKDAESSLPPGIPRPFQSAHEFRAKTGFGVISWVRTGNVVSGVPILFLSLFVVLLYVSLRF